MQIFPEKKPEIRIDRDGVSLLLRRLAERGFETVGPTVRDEAIVYDRLTRVEDLPIGWTDAQDAGWYRLKRREDDALFGYAVGPHSWKKYLFPPVLTLWQARKNDHGFEVTAATPSPRKLAFIGVRACELQAIAVQDRVFCEGTHADPHYASQRANLILIAVNCTEPAGTCFCVSMDAGPRARSGYDLALTEVRTAADHFFVVEVGSEQGGELLSEIPHTVASPEEITAAHRRVEMAADRMGRTMPAEGLRDLLYRHLEHPRWDEVAERCLACGNCTMVCPTCFCSTVEAVTDLSGASTEQRRRWDSCFTLNFSYAHGTVLRSSHKARYRQWMTHKLATWIDQFGTSGCVGCGRCITWCPVGIDITEEVQAIRGEDGCRGS